MHGKDIELLDLKCTINDIGYNIMTVQYLFDNGVEESFAAKGRKDCHGDYPKRVGIRECAIIGQNTPGQTCDL